MDLGKRGEDLAARFLERKGYRIVARSSRTEFGEIDLIAIEGRTIVFVEVKTRRNHDRGHPADAVDESKQQRLTRLALAWLKRERLLEVRSRFDVIGVIWAGDGKLEKIEHFPNAFAPQGRWQMFS